MLAPLQGRGLTPGCWRGLQQQPCASTSSSSTHAKRAVLLRPPSAFAAVDGNLARAPAAWHAAAGKTQSAPIQRRRLGRTAASGNGNGTAASTTGVCCVRVCVVCVWEWRARALWRAFLLRTIKAQCPFFTATSKLARCGRAWPPDQMRARRRRLLGRRLCCCARPHNSNTPTQTQTTQNTLKRPRRERRDRRQRPRGLHRRHLRRARQLEARRL